jgi:hypothetical protein
LFGKPEHVTYMYAAKKLGEFAMEFTGERVANRRIYGKFYILCLI